MRNGSVEAMKAGLLCNHCERVPEAVGVNDPVVHPCGCITERVVAHDEAMGGRIVAFRHSTCDNDPDKCPIVLSSLVLSRRRQMPIEVKDRNPMDNDYG